MNIDKYIQNPRLFRENDEPNRSYYIPFEKRDSVFDSSRENSDRFQLLSGIWSFRFEKNLKTVSQSFLNTFSLPETAVSKEEFDEINVPSCWQLLGYDSNQYTNIRYPFPFDPPFVPRDNPCGIYVKDFDVDFNKKAYKKYLNFEGVDSCCLVYLNGEYIGYHQVSHCTTEYNITDSVRDGRNRLLVLVMKWCDGSYLEDQDKLRMSGIFRDVYILYRPQNHIKDYTVKTTLDFDSDSAAVECFLQTSGGDGAAECSLFAPDGTLCAKKAAENGKVSYNLEDPTLWNAENPQLYTLLLTYGDETIEEKVGIREITADGGVLKVNGKPIKLRGANRHDSNPERGSAVTKDDILCDLLLMKRHNINALRTSHYPNSPLLPKLADELGFYLFAEADIESHGQETIYKPAKEDCCYFGESKDYHDAIIDRVARLISRDKNRSCVICWSLGNESGFGTNFEDAAKYAKAADPTRLVHYEHVWNYLPGKTPDFSNLDFYSRMYPSMDDIKSELDKEPKKALVMCEYCHSMGNGPGDLEDYAEVINNTERFAGGFIWEWCEHSVKTGVTPDGRKKFLYGGDFGEYPHDGNFCIDGMVSSDRIPSTGLLEYKNVLRPIRAVCVDRNKLIFSFKNCRDFLNVAGNIAIDYEVTENGAAVEHGNLGSPEIAPHEEKAVTVTLKKKYTGVTFIKFNYKNIHENSCLKANEELGFDEIRLSDESVAFEPKTLNVKSSPITLEDGENEITVSSSSFKYVFDKDTGLFSEMTVNGKEVLSAPMEYNIYRAPTDNDSFIGVDWAKAGYDCAKSRVYDCSAENCGDSVIIKAKVGILPVYRQRILTVETTLIVLENGKVLFGLKAEKNPIFPTLPRFGVRIFLNNGYEKLSYFGYGPNESYVDMHRASYIGLFDSTVTTEQRDYIKPQENGLHYGCEFAEVAAEDGAAVRITGEKFSFNASHYTEEELAKKKHNFELIPSGKTVLCVDYKQNGIGSQSCGPMLLEKYRFDETEFEFKFDMLAY